MQIIQSWFSGANDRFLITVMHHIPFVAIATIASLGFVLCIWGLLKSKGEVMGKIIFGFTLMLSGVVSIAIFVSSALMMEAVMSMFSPPSHATTPLIATGTAGLYDDMAVPIIFSTITAASGLCILIRGLIERENKEKSL